MTQLGPAKMFNSDLQCQQEAAAAAAAALN